MDLAEFRATRQPCSDEHFAEFQEDLPNIPQEAIHVYCDWGVIHEAEGRYWVHAWWRSPIAYDDLATAEEKLLPWYNEFH